MAATVDQLEHQRAEVKLRCEASIRVGDLEAAEQAVREIAELDARIRQANGARFGANDNKR